MYLEWHFQETTGQFREVQIEEVMDGRILCSNVDSEKFPTFGFSKWLSPVGPMFFDIIMIYWELMQTSTAGSL